MKKQLVAMAVAIAAALAATSADAAWVAISDFEGLTLGDVSGQDGWATSPSARATYDVVVDPDDPTNQVLQARGDSVSDPDNGNDQANGYVSIGADAVGVGSTGTLFFRMRSSELSDIGFGYIDVATPAGWGDFESYAIMGFTGSGGNFQSQLKVRNGGTFANLGNFNGDEWYNFWLVADNDANTSALYWSQGSDPAALAGTGAFRTGNGDPADALTGLNIRMGRSHGLTGNAFDSTSYLDDIYVTTGQNLTNPIVPEPAAAVLFAAVMGLVATRRPNR